MYENVAYELKNFEYEPMTEIKAVEEEENSPEKLIGEGVKFERIRRITGYLVGTLDRFNDAKYAEVQDRVKHSISAGGVEGLERI